MSPDAEDEEFVVLQVCPDHLAAEVLANFLTTHGVPSVVRNYSVLPGLAQGAEVRVPARCVHRARWLNAMAIPTDAELDALATGSRSSRGDPAA